MLPFGKTLFLFTFLLVAFEGSLTINLNNTFLNINEMTSYLQHFNTESFLNKTSWIKVTRSILNKQAKIYLNELLNEYLRQLNNIKFKLTDTSGSYKESFAYFNVIFIDSFQAFRKIGAGPISRTEDFSEYYLVIYYSLDEEPEKEIQKIFDYFWHYYIVNVALLLKPQNDKPILLYTYYPFTQNSCKKAEMYIMNENKSILQLNASEMFPNKFANFHNCTLRAALWNVPPYLTLPVTGSTSTKMGGIEGYLLNVLGKLMKFQIDFLVPPNNEQRGIVKEDGTLTGAIKMLDEHVADLSLGSFRCTLQRSTALSPSTTFYQTMQVFTVLALHLEWSSLEIVAYAFDKYIWIVLGILMLFWLIFPHILKMFSPRILKFLYGFSSVYFINISIIGITLNQPSPFLPQRNFARYILSMWILLTMLLRSIYQGSLQDFLTTQQNEAPPDTAQDLIALKYKLIVNMATNDTLSGVPIIRDKLMEVIIMNITDYGGFPILEANPDKRYVTATPKDFFTYYVKYQNKNGLFHVLKEKIFAQQLCVYFSKHSYLVNTFDNVLKNWRYFGLIDYWANNFLGSSIQEESVVRKANAALTLNQLSTILIICLCLYIISIIMFVCEIVWFKLNGNCTSTAHDKTTMEVK